MYSWVQHYMYTGTFAASVQNFSLFTRKIVPVYMYAQNAHKLIKYKSCL
jgi:hypothetical protein